jgi:hypothetical protein
MITSALTTIACAGHVLVDLPIFMGPVIGLVGWLLFVTRRQRRRERVAAAPTPRPGPPSSASA